VFGQMEYDWYEPRKVTATYMRKLPLTHFLPADSVVCYMCLSNVPLPFPPFQAPSKRLGIGRWNFKLQNPVAKIPLLPLCGSCFMYHSFLRFSDVKCSKLLVAGCKFLVTLGNSVFAGCCWWSGRSGFRNGEARYRFRE